MKIYWNKLLKLTYTYIHTYTYTKKKKKLKKIWGGGHCPPSPTIVLSLSVIDDEPVKLETTSWQFMLFFTFFHVLM